MVWFLSIDGVRETGVLFESSLFSPRQLHRGRETIGRWSQSRHTTTRVASMQNYTSNIMIYSTRVVYSGTMDRVCIPLLVCIQLSRRSTEAIVDRRHQQEVTAGKFCLFPIAVPFLSLVTFSLVKRRCTQRTADHDHRRIAASPQLCAPSGHRS